VVWPTEEDMTEKSNVFPFRQVRAHFSEQTLRVYQAYSPQIADAALAAQRFRSPFKRERMTWIKPSFTWMMYRCGWGEKPNQERILGIDILRSGFEWALGHASLSHFESATHGNHELWQAQLRSSPVRIQWDPERTLKLEELPWRAIQVGIGGKAVDTYVDQWIVGIEDVTPLAREVKDLVDRGELELARRRVPAEHAYPLSEEIARRIGSARIELQSGDEP
jgi:hypothetical protein